MARVNGVAFVCLERDQKRKCQNSEVVIDGGYYGVLLEVVELIYGEGLTMYVFECRWFDTNTQSQMDDNYGLLSVDTSTSWYEGDPFVFATSAKPVYYLDDLVKKGAWKTVNHVATRNIYNAATLGQTVDKDDNEAYQEPDTTNIPSSSTILLNNVVEGQVVRLHGEERRFTDVATDELCAYSDEDDDEEFRHMLPVINSDTETDSSGDSDYEP
ncbi:hypothetical protein OROGR_025541 [Orobanche gracilis]